MNTTRETGRDWRGVRTNAHYTEVKMWSLQRRGRLEVNIYYRLKVLIVFNLNIN